MVDSVAASRPRRGPDPFALGAVVFLIMSLVFAAYPALSGGAMTPAAMLLLVGMAGAAVFVVVLFSLDARSERASGTDRRTAELVEAMGDAAAVARGDGRIDAANAGWRALWSGDARRLPRAAGGLYAALAAARRDGQGEAAVSTRDGPRRARVSRVGGERLLVRLLPVVAEPPPPPPAPLPEPPQAPSAVAPAALDAFAVAAPFGAALLDGSDPFEAEVMQVNGALAAMTGGRAKPGTTLGALIEPASRAEAAGRLAAGRAGPVEVRLAGEPGPPRVAHLYLTAAEGRTLGYLLDVTEQKQLELQLGQSQKMQAIGQLAGGVAHDFNNLLSAIQLRLDELLHRHPVGDPSYEGLNEIRQTAVRAADLVKKLLAFSRKQTVQRETLDLGDLIREFELLLRRLLREDVRLTTEQGRDLPLVRADKGQLETAVMNLAVNARDALRSHGAHDGEPAAVHIRTARASQAEALQLGWPEPPADGAAMIEVADNGPGIGPEAMQKIFEPFFTTKPVGEGTGLGLATVYGIVKQADGWVHVDSAPGRGAAFRIFLPIHQPVEGAAEAAPAPKPKPQARDLSGAGRILFVEDEDAVRVVAARLLRARGYEVIEAADGEEALDLAEEHAGKIDLLISDVIMPGLDGPTLLKKARPFLADASVMFISGYAEAEFSDLLEGEEGVTFLPKPIDIKVLAERVKQQLQGG